MNHQSSPIAAQTAVPDARLSRPAHPAHPALAQRAHPGLVWPALLLLVLAVAWFATLGMRTLVHPDEGRYATLALAMMQTGDWITPRLNGLLYFEKPPFQYWMGAIAFHLFGINEFAARFWPGAAGLMTVFATGYTAHRLWGRDAGVQASAIAGGTTWILLNSHVLTLDMGLCFFLTLVLGSVLIAFHGQGPTNRTGWLMLAWAAMAGAVLSKGLIGIVIPGFVLVASAIWRRNLSIFRGMHWATGLLLMLALAVPWFVLVSMRNPDFAEFFFIHEHFARYLTKVHQREGAWWYYVPLLVVGLLPWTAALPFVLRPRRGDLQAGPIEARHLLLLWCGFIFLFFSVSGSKLPSYILPMFPALALLITLELRQASLAALRQHFWVPVAIWAAALVLSTQIDHFASLLTPIEVLTPIAAAVRWGAVLFLAGACVAWWLLKRERVTPALAVLALCHSLALLGIVVSHNDYGQLKSAAPFDHLVRPLAAPNVPVFSVRSYDQTLPFYLGRNVTLVDYVDEFALGEKREPERWIDNIDTFIAEWQRLPQAIAYVDRLTWIELFQRGVPMKTVYEDTRRFVVTKP